jgi:hypothetical protein
MERLGTKGFKIVGCLGFLDGLLPAVAQQFDSDLLITNRATSSTEIRPVGCAWMEIFSSEAGAPFEMEMWMADLEPLAGCQWTASTSRLFAFRRL